MQHRQLPNITEFLSVSSDKAAKLIGVESPSLDKDRRVGHLGIPYIKAGRRVLYSVSDLQTWLSSNKLYPVNKEDSQ